MEKDAKIVKDWLQTGSINIFGLPFVGKDTQCERLAELVGAPAPISGGAIARSMQDNEEVQAIMATGALLPSDVYENIVVPYLQRHEYNDHPLVLSSVGRMDGEQAVIVSATAKAGHPVMAVVLLTMPEEMVWQRFEQSHHSADRGERRDDNLAVLQKRVKEFNEKTIPVLNYYREQGLLVEVDGTGTKDNVTTAMIAALAQKAQID